MKPQFARALVEGRKRFEFRRARPNLRSGDIVYVYATAPVQAVIGSFVCGGVVDGSPTRLWASVGAESETTRAYFRQYFRDRGRAFAIEVTSPRYWRTPLSLGDLQARLPGFCPPQSYRFVPTKIGAVA